jgi:hypothetical protein
VCSGRREGELVFNGDRASVWEDGEVLETIAVAMPLSCTLRSRSHGKFHIILPNTVLKSQSENGPDFARVSSYSSGGGNFISHFGEEDNRCFDFKSLNFRKAREAWPRKFLLLTKRGANPKPPHLRSVTHLMAGLINHESSNVEGRERWCHWFVTQ